MTTETKATKNLLGLVLVLGLFGYVGYLFFRAVIGDHFLKKEGVCTKAVLYMETRGSHTGWHFGYRFYLGGKEYDGLVKERAGLKIGDSVCVVYLLSHPGVNKAVEAFDQGEIGCDCR